MPLTIEHLSDYLLVSGDGLPDLAEAQQHFRDLSALLVVERRTVRRQVRVLIDLSAAHPHPPEVAAHITRALPLLYKAGDRVAVVVPSSTVKADTQGSHDPGFSQIFLSREGAEEYLTRPA